MSETTLTYKPRLADELLDELLNELSALMIVGPRAVGKTTTISRRAATVIRLNSEVEAAAFVADADAALRGLPEPVLLDEWQQVPSVFGAVRRAVEADPRPNRFFLTGSVRAELENETWPGTGRIVRLPLYPMTIRELLEHRGGTTFFDRVAAGDQLKVPANSPDLHGYVELALQSGFPIPATRLTGRTRQVWFASYLDDLFTHDVEQLEDLKTRKRDPQRLRSYFEAYALNSAGVTDHRTIYGAAGITKATATSYEQLLSRLQVVEQLPAWTSNRLKRLIKQPKRYVVDPALIAASLRVDARGVLADGGLLGRVLDTFVAAQLRPEAVVSPLQPRLFHLRTEQGRQEIDIVAELGGQRIVGLEIKANAAPGAKDARHLMWLRDAIGKRFVAGVVFHTGPRAYELDDRIIAAPISVLWA
jgi:predicted AAA+ superfamily ATPase